MTALSRPLCNDALRIWRAGVAAVDPERLLQEAIQIHGRWLTIETTRGDALEIDTQRLGRLIVVGGGKAGAGMARGLESALQPLGLSQTRFAGTLSVPADCAPANQVPAADSKETLKAIRLVAGRPAGINEPRLEGARAAESMLSVVAEAGPEDIVICLLSGGGSALLPAPCDGVTLEDKVAVARLLAAAGADIEQLNTVRQQVSRIKGGGLLRACRAGRLVTLILSDVLGDPLDLIASGPTTLSRSTRHDALAVLDQFDLTDDPRLSRVVAALRSTDPTPTESPTAEAETLVLANNTTAVDAAGVEAERLGYSHAMNAARESEGAAEEVGSRLAQMALRMRDSVSANEPDCLITGGEPTVKLAPPEIRGKGGRNQQVVLAALAELGDCQNLAMVSGGTDGEDGPTDAAGAMIDSEIADRITKAGVTESDLADALRRNDAYPLFKSVDALLMTGPTHTNVCDLRVVTVERAN